MSAATVSFPRIASSTASGGREFRSARDAERAARALFLERRHLVSGQLFAAF
jgi:hypothetical protein